MDINERFVYNEVDDETPKKSPQSNQTWPMDKIRQRSFQQRMSSLLSPVTPKRNYSTSNARSLLLQCLRDSKTDPLPRRRRFPAATCADDGVLMDCVLVTSATTKKKVTDSLGRSSTHSSSIKNPPKNAEFSSPTSKSELNQETTRSEQVSHAIVKISPTKVETPKAAANPSKLQASAEPFSPQSPQQQLPYDHYYNPQFPWANLPPSLHLHPYPFLCRPGPPFYFYQSPSLLPMLPHEHDLSQLGPTGIPINRPPIRNETYQLNCPVTFPSLTGNDDTNNPLPAPINPDGPDTMTEEPDLSSPNNGPETVTQEEPPSDGTKTMLQETDMSSTSARVETMPQTEDLASTSVGLETSMQAQDLASTSAGPETMPQQTQDLASTSARPETVTQTQDLSSHEVKAMPLVAADLSSSLSSDGTEPVTQTQDLSSSPSAAGVQTMMTKKDWSPSDEKKLQSITQEQTGFLKPESFTQEQKDFVKEHNRILPDIFENYKYTSAKRLACFKDFCPDEEEEDQ